MKIKTPSDDFFLLPRQLLDKLPGASAAEVKVLLYLYAWKEAETPAIASALRLTPNEVDAAIAFWRGAGVFEPDDSAPKKQLPASTSLFRNYDTLTISETLNGKPDFKACCDLVAQTLEKQPLTRNDLSSLLYLYDYVGLPAELISGIAVYCVQSGKKAMQYIMKTALRMYEENGIDSYAKLEAHLAKLEQRKTHIAFVRRLFGMGDRQLSTKEDSMLQKWFGEWELSDELVRLAFDKTVDSLGKANLAYMNTMLKRWYENGMTSPEEVAQKDQKPASGSIAGYGDSDAFFEAALKAGMKDWDETN